MQFLAFFFSSLHCIAFCHRNLNPKRHNIKPIHLIVLHFVISMTRTKSSMIVGIIHQINGSKMQWKCSCVTKLHMTSLFFIMTQIFLFLVHQYDLFWLTPLWHQPFDWRFYCRFLFKHSSCLVLLVQTLKIPLFNTNLSLPISFFLPSLNSGFPLNLVHQFADAPPLLQVEIWKIKTYSFSPMVRLTWIPIAQFNFLQNKPAWHTWVLSIGFLN